MDHFILVIIIRILNMLFTKEKAKGIRHASLLFNVFPVKYFGGYLNSLPP